LNINSFPLLPVLSLFFSFSGTTGAQIQLLVNCFLLNFHRTEGHALIYQYHVDFKPNVENKEMRIAMVKQQRDIIGSVSAFDGMGLFLPQKLPEEVSKI
jgi:hypothetical protein